MGLEFSPWLWAAITLTMFAAGLSQGAMGFGFPAISTPLLALMTDIKTAVLLNLLPNMTVNIISVIQGGNWRASLGVHWPVAVYALILQGADHPLHHAVLFRRARRDEFLLQPITLD